MHLLSNKFKTDQGLKYYITPFWFDFIWISYFHLNFVGDLIFTWWNQCEVLEKKIQVTTFSLRYLKLWHIYGRFASLKHNNFWNEIYVFLIWIIKKNISNNIFLAF